MTKLPTAVITGPRGAKTVLLDGHAIPAVRTIEVVADAHDVEVLWLAILCDRIEYGEDEGEPPHPPAPDPALMEDARGTS